MNEPTAILTSRRDWLPGITLASVLAVAGLIFWTSSGGSGPKGWSYHFADIEIVSAKRSVTAHVEAERKIKEAVLDAGREGWELVSTLPRTPYGEGSPGHLYYQLIFKRPGVFTGPPGQYELDLRQARSLKAIESASKERAEEFAQELKDIARGVK